MKKDKLILFGAGRNGILALKKYGREKVAFFCDNSVKKQGTEIEGILVISFEEMMSFYQNGYIIMVTPADNIYLIGQLELEGISDYLLFRNEEVHLESNNIKEEYAYENSILDDLVERSRELDLLRDVKEFAKLSQKALQMSKDRKFFLAYPGPHMESKFYGNLQALSAYAGISKEDEKYFPITSHEGSVLQYGVSFRYKSAVVMMGSYYREKIHKRVPYVPVFTVGPYIHYVENIYSRCQIENTKKENGRTLLVFLPHSIENVERRYGKMKFINDVVCEYRSQFQSIWLCVYWADINDPICEYAENVGIHVVTAGFRFDSHFDRRLKSIIEIADAVICGDIGTFLSYAIYMGKPIGRLDISDNSTIAEIGAHTSVEKKLQASEEYKEYTQQFFKLFGKDIKSTIEQRKWMEPESGFSQIRDRQYIRNVFEISKDIWMQCKENLSGYPEAVRKVYFSYDERAEIDKMMILRSAVGSYVD